MIAPISPPRSNISLSPIPSSSVKMRKPTTEPAKPSRMVTKKPPGSLPGMRALPMNPASMPRMSAPIMRRSYPSTEIP